MIIKNSLQAKALFYFYIFTLILCVIGFGHTDIIRTYTSSYTLFSGHFFDFYSFNSIHAYDEVYRGKNDYLPIIYLMFAIWDFPLHILGLTSNLQDTNTLSTTFIEVAWSKLLPALFFFLSVFEVSKISRFLMPANHNNRIPHLLFATSPIAIFIVFIFSQYDIFGLFFVLLGVKYLLKKKYPVFLLFFSLAISFKYYAIGIFLPFILMVEKNIFKLGLYFICGLFFSLAQIFLFWQDYIFQQSFFSLAMSKIGGGLTHNHFFQSRALYILFVFFGLLVYLYLKNYKMLPTKIFQRDIIFIPIVFFGLLFLFVSPHPQWFISLMPFFALSLIFTKKYKLFLIFDLIGFIAFIWICVNRWPGNLDFTMLNFGIFSQQPHFLASSLMPKLLLPFFTLLFFLFGTSKIFIKFIFE